MEFQQMAIAGPGPFPNFFRGQKIENFTMAPTGNFCFVFLILRNPPMEIEKVVVIIYSH